MRIISAKKTKRRVVGDAPSSEWQVEWEVSGEAVSATYVMGKTAANARRHGLLPTYLPRRFDAHAADRQDRYRARAGTAAIVKDLHPKDKRLPELVVKSYHPRTWMTARLPLNMAAIQKGAEFMRAQGVPCFVAMHQHHSNPQKPFMLMQRLGRGRDLFVEDKKIIKTLSEAALIEVYLRFFAKVQAYGRAMQRPYGDLKNENLLPILNEEAALVDLVLVDADGAFETLIPATIDLLSSEDLERISSYNRSGKKASGLDINLDARIMAVVMAEFLIDARPGFSWQRGKMNPLASDRKVKVNMKKAGQLGALYELFASMSSGKDFYLELLAHATLSSYAKVFANAYQAFAKRWQTEMGTAADHAEAKREESEGRVVPALPEVDLATTVKGVMNRGAGFWSSEQRLAVSRQEDDTIRLVAETKSGHRSGCGIG